MKNLISLCSAVILSIGFLNAQNLIYTISGELNNEKVALDSILIKNVTNTTSIVFGDLQVQEYYEIDLTNWKTTGIEQIPNLPGFIVSQNIPGTLVLTNSGNRVGEIRLSVYNINGQMVYSTENKLLYLKNSVQIELGASGVFMVKLDSPYGTQSFKTVGAENSTGYKISLIDKTSMQTENKSAIVSNYDDFSYHTGDSIQISVFKENFEALPANLSISESDSVNIVFNGSFTDARDSTTYTTVKIEAQTWIVEPLAYLPQLNLTSDRSQTEPCYYIFDHQDTVVSIAKEEANYKTYGVLYNWPASKTACPEGWHLPTNAEWEELAQYIANDHEYSKGVDGWEDVGKHLKTTGTIEDGDGLWQKWPDISGLDDYGFSGLPGGRITRWGQFFDLNDYAYWWTATEQDDMNAVFRFLTYHWSNFSSGYDLYRTGHYVRCVKD